MYGLGICIVVPLAFVVFSFVWFGVACYFKPKRRWFVLASSVPAFLLVLVCSVIYVDPHFVTQRPEVTDVIGHYSLTSQTVTDSGLTALRGNRCAIELRPDGTFTATNLPPDKLDSPGPDFFDTLVTASGNWRFGVVSHDRSFNEHWGIIFNASPVSIHPVHLDGWKPPYRLYIFLGDPDCDDIMILEREEKKNPTP